MLLQHPDIADVAVIGIDSKEQATELPRFVTSCTVSREEIYFSLLLQGIRSTREPSLAQGRQRQTQIREKRAGMDPD